MAMFLLFLNQWIPEPALKALCWTFVHSLWQGMVAAFIAGLIILSTRKTSASFRYNLLVLLFAFFLAAVGANFFKQLSRFDATKNSDTTVTLSTPNIILTPFQEDISATTTQNKFTDSLTIYFNEHAPFVVLLWALFLLIKCLKLTSGLYYIHQLKKSGTSPASVEWSFLIQRLSEKLGLNKKVALLESPKIYVPLAVGYLKATIMIPLGLLANLPPDQVEAVLLHELAHIRRRDYLVNLLQSGAETIFFFNPGLLWISSLIRQEREACCDDIVLAHLPQKKSYLEALVSFQEYSLAHSGQVVALTHKKNALLHRVQRMLKEENQKLNSMEKTALILGIIAITAFGFISKKESLKSEARMLKQESFISLTKPAETIRVASIAPVAEHKRATKRMQPMVRKDTVPPAKKEPVQNDRFTNVITQTQDDGKTKLYEIRLQDDEGKQYHIKKVDGVVTKFTIDGKQVDPSEKRYAEVLSQIEKREVIRAKKTAEVAQKRKEVAQAKQKEQEQRREVMAKKIAERKSEQKEKRADQEKRKEELKMKYEEQRKFQKEYSYKRADSLQKVRPAKRMNYANAKKQFAGNNGEVGAIINDLKQNQLISNEDVFSFSLNNKELIVNGKKQPAALHESLKQKYIHKQGDLFNYSKNGGSTSLTINKE